MSGQAAMAVYYPRLCLINVVLAVLRPRLDWPRAKSRPAWAWSVQAEVVRRRQQDDGIKSDSSLLLLARMLSIA
ncbi:MAG: hypothetical protein ING52_15225 [Burkholderiales bacterium]|nr:hypothetical protein [Rhodocyclaceae bacterium]MCA3226830.1 hypothetical protein [Burkholderiales bacterium]